MIIVDLSQVCISNLMVTLRGHTNTPIEEGILRHLILNQIRSFNQKYKNEFGELVIACDNKYYWRKGAYRYYKTRRASDRAKSDLDWNSIFASLNNIRAELKEYFPYRVIDVPNAEADDVIATLCHKFGNEDMNFGEQILILSGDKDFGQLQTYQNVQQYNPTQKKKIVVNNPKDFLLEHIIRGDVGDGIPNMLSDDDTFAENKRQTPITEKKFKELKNKLEQGILSDTEKRNYMRNKEMIDLSMVPAELQEAILAEYDAQGGKNRSKLFNYFIKYKLKNLQGNIGDF